MDMASTFGPPRMRTVEPDELAEHDAKQSATVCPRCFAPLTDAVYFISAISSRRERPDCADCFAKDRDEYYGPYFWRRYGHDYDWVCTPETEHRQASAGCGRTMVIGYHHAHVRACSVRCDELADLARRRARHAEARAGRRCAECDELIDADRSDAKFCSPACKQKAYRARHAVTANDSERSRRATTRNGHDEVAP